MAKILIVDDQATFLLTLDKILKQHGHEVTAVSNAFDALAHLKALGTELLITDAIMPGPTGFDLVTTLRRMENFKALPIIMLTGKRGQKDVEKSIRSGVNAYIVKPIVPSVLVAKIAGLLQIKADQVVLKIVPVTLMASWQDTTKIIEISENGFTIESNVTVPAGYPISINTELYDQIGTSNLALTVVESAADRSQPGRFKIQTVFTDISDKDLSALREWIKSAQVKIAS